jgi:hypothetical protein
MCLSKKKKVEQKFGRNDQTIYLNRYGEDNRKKKSHLTATTIALSEANITTTAKPFNSMQVEAGYK